MGEALTIGSGVVAALPGVGLAYATFFAFQAAEDLRGLELLGYARGILAKGGVGR